MTTDTDGPNLLDDAAEILRAAGDLTLEWFRNDELTVEHKGDGTPVTVADKAAERLLREEIERRWPADAILGEEEGATEGTSGRRWIIDPIDGTKAFTAGVPLYTNLLGLVDDDGPLLGLVNVPALGEMVLARRGQGCWLDRTGHDRVEARVGGVGELDRAHVTTSGFSVWPDHALLDLKRRGVRLRTWGDGYGYVLVATGRVEAMVDPIANPWDLAPMPVVITEAGGRFSDLSGNEGFDGGSGLATNGAVHHDLLGAFAP